MRNRAFHPRRAIGGVGVVAGNPVGAVVAPPVTPLTIMGANCRMWCRSDLGITIGTGVSAWADQSGNGNNWAQATGSSQPAYNATGGPNSRQSLLFDGVDDSLTSTLTRAAPGVTPGAIWLIARQVTWTINEPIMHDASTAYAVIQRTASPGIAQNNGTVVNLNNALTVNSYFRIQAEFTNSVADRLLVGPTSVTGANAGNTAGTGPILGMNGAGTLWGNIEVCEVGIFNVIPSAGQTSQLDSYVTSIYGAGLV